MITIKTPNDLLIEILGGVDLKLLKNQKKILSLTQHTLSGLGQNTQYIAGILNLLDVITDFMEDNPDEVRGFKVRRKDRLVEEGKI